MKLNGTGEEEKEDEDGEEDEEEEKEREQEEVGGGRGVEEVGEEREEGEKEKEEEARRMSLLAAFQRCVIVLAFVCRQSGTRVSAAGRPVAAYPPRVAGPTAIGRGTGELSLAHSSPDRRSKPAFLFLVAGCSGVALLVVDAVLQFYATWLSRTTVVTR